MKNRFLALCSVLALVAGCTEEHSSLQEGRDFAQARQAIEIGDALSPKVSGFVRTTYGALELEAQLATPNWLKLRHTFLPVRGSGELQLVVEASRAISSAETDELEAIGAEVLKVQESPGVVRVWLPFEEIEAVADLEWVTAIKEPPIVFGEQAANNVLVTEGVATHNADEAQAAGITGAGETIGVISIGSPNIAASIALGELPPLCPQMAGVCQFGQMGFSPCICTNTPTLTQGGCTDATNDSCDEGTAMLEIVADMAPGADLIFATPTGTYAQTLDAVVAAGATIVTEDLAFDTDPAFQQGANAARADFHSNSGISIHASAGNLGNNHAAQVLATGTGTTPDGVVFPVGGPANCGGATPNNTVAIAGAGDTTFDVNWGASPSITLQWSEPRNAAPTAGAGGFTDLQVFVMDQALTQCLIPPTNVVQANGVGDSLEFVSDPPAGATCGTGGVPPVPLNCIPNGTAVKIVVNVNGTSNAAAVPTLDLRMRGLGVVDAATRAGSLNPDSNFTALANAVASSANGAGVNATSSGGPFQLGLTTSCAAGCTTGCGPAGSLDSNGNPVSPACQGATAAGNLVASSAPEWTARDGVSVTGVGQFGAAAGGGECGAAGTQVAGQCRFFGTSAAAPHSAGCAALVGEVLGAGRTVAAINQRMSSTATNLGAGANVEGAGLLDCFEALDPPTATCSDQTVDADDSCQGSVTVDDIDAGSIDNQGPLGSRTLAPSGPFGLGPHPVVLTVTDSDNLPRTCNATVTVQDVTPPEFVESSLPAVTMNGCAADGQVFTLTVPSASDNCSVDVSGAITASDNADFQALLPLPVDPVTGEVTLPVGTHTVTWTVTDGVQNDTLTQTINIGSGILASQELLVRHRASLTTEGGWASLINLGNGPTTIESASHVGGILSVGSINVDGSTVHGDASSAGQVSPYNGGDVTGDELENQILSLPDAPTLAVTFPPPSASHVVNTFLDLPPGSYGSVTVNSGNQNPPTLVLSSGDYHFTQLLTVNSSSRIIIDDSSGPVRIFVQDQFDYRSSFQHEDGTLAEVFVGFLGQQLIMEANFRGVLVAPNANVEFGTSQAMDFAGQFFARKLVFRDDTRVQCLSDSELDFGTDPPSCSDGVLNVDETDVDCGGIDCDACDDGSSCQVASDCTSGVCPLGTCVAPTCTDGVENGLETGEDCGGPCPACPVPCEGATYQAVSMFHSTGNAWWQGGWNIYSNGYIGATHSFSPGPSVITVSALGQQAAGLPHMRVTVGGSSAVPTAGVNVTTGGFNPYQFTFNAAGGPQEIRIIFDNDYNGWQGDRNLIVQSATVSCP